MTLFQRCKETLRLWGQEMVIAQGRVTLHPLRANRSIECGEPLPLPILALTPAPQPWTHLLGGPCVPVLSSVRDRVKFIGTQGTGAHGLFCEH